MRYQETVADTKNPKNLKNIDVFVCEDTADLHFINVVTKETIEIINN